MAIPGLSIDLRRHAQAEASMKERLRLCMVGDGEMAGEHSRSAAAIGCVLDTVVGQIPTHTEAFARAHGYERWTTALDDGLHDEIDAVVVANPSFAHVETTLAAVVRGKPTLVEIPLAMTLADAERLVKAAAAKGVALATDHPIRLRPDLVAIRERAAAGEERILHIAAQQFMRNKRVIEWKARRDAGDPRAWMDNLLWHNMLHSIDTGLWLLGSPIKHVQSWMSPLDPVTGTQMDAFVAVETEDSRLLTCNGSYFGHDIYQMTIVTDRETYRFDQRNSTFASRTGVKEIDKPYVHLSKVIEDFVTSVLSGKQPALAAESVLPALRVLQHTQDAWDRAHPGIGLVNGRPLGP
jgi:2-hydroxy-4-carboxymuconate semialdehyde hemiacetal dehydrogenase